MQGSTDVRGEYLDNGTYDYEQIDLPESIIDRKVRNMRMISPSNREVDISLDKVYQECI